MNKILISAAALLLGLSSCTKEMPFDPSNQQDGQTRVSLTLTGSTNSDEYGITRAAGADGNVSEKLAASAEEKKVNNLLAVAFYKTGTNAGKIYDIFEVKDIDTPNPWFDMAKEGSFWVWFVANANAELKGKILALKETETSTEKELNELVGKQLPDTKNEFLMVSTDKKSITTNNGLTTSLSVLMRRASVRYDIINRINGITITKVEFKNYAVDTHISTPNTQTTGTTFTENKVYGTEAEPLAIVGYEIPKEPQKVDNEKKKASEFERQIYSYENLNETPGGKISTLVLTYTVAGTGVEKTHTVEFKTPKTKDNPKQEQLALKRNHLYRIVLTEKHEDLKIVAKIVVEDWNTAVEFNVEEIPYVNSATADLLVNMFTPYEVQNFDIAAKKVVSFNSSMVNAAPATAELQARKYFSFEQLETAQLAGASSGTISGPIAGEEYRLPTVGEMNLLFPAGAKKDVTSDPQNPVFSMVLWGENKVPWSENKVYIMNPEAFDETLSLTNDAEGKEDATGVQIKGKSILKRAADGLVTDSEAQCYPVYGVRFEGTAQYAAYRWENHPNKYFSIKIKALNPTKDGDLTTAITKVATEEFWKGGGYLEFKLPKSGWLKETVTAAETLQNTNNSGYMQVSTKHSNPQRVYLGSGCQVYMNIMIADIQYGNKTPLRLVDNKKAAELYKKHEANSKK